jgi:neutral trehalase
LFTTTFDSDQNKFDDPLQDDTIGPVRSLEREKVGKKEFTRVHFYDHDLTDMYDFTFQRLKESWKRGTPENGLQGRYFNHAHSDRINQFEACMATFFLVYSNRIFPVFSALDNFYSKQEPNGAIRGEYSERTGKPILSRPNPEGALPPLFAWAEYNIYHKIGLKKRIKEVMPILEQHHSWLENTFKKDNGLLSVPLEATMMVNAPREEATYPVDFNTQMALNALYLSALGDILNDKEIAYKYKKDYFSFKTRISSMMWNEHDHLYYDLDKSEKQIKVKSAASFWPLLAEIPNEVRAEALVAQLTNPKTFGLENPFPSLAASEPSFDPRGGGFNGSVFPFITYMIVKGLEKYGKYELARECSVKHLYYVLEGLHTEEGLKGTLWEAYAAAQEGPAVWPRHPSFPRPLFLPYAALSTVALMIENVVGLYISLPRKTVDWIVPNMELMGIEDLNLKRNTISILSNKSGRGWEIRLESEKLYYLTVNILGSKKKTLPIPSGKCSILIDKI